MTTFSRRSFLTSGGLPALLPSKVATFFVAACLSQSSCPKRGVMGRRNRASRAVHFMVYLPAGGLSLLLTSARLLRPPARGLLLSHPLLKLSEDVCFALAVAH